MTRMRFDLMIAVVVTCAVAALGLAGTYAVTAERIVEQQRLAEARSLKSVLPDASEFQQVEDAKILQSAEAEAEGVFVSAFRALASDGALIGWGVRVQPRGYGGPMQMVVGLDRNGKVTGASILSMNETPGLGTRIQSDKWFLEQFAGVEASGVDKQLKALDVIAGATKSSRGVNKGVAAAAHVYEKVLSKAGGE